MHKTPCHVIAGPLGVGKTTAILHELKRQPPDARIGILVNDFGPIGLDHARLGTAAPQTKVIQLQGGCICCTLLASLPEAVCRLLDEHELDRLIIEPSGMASPAQVIQALLQPELKAHIQMQPTIVLLSAVEFDEQTFDRMPYYRSLCDVAEVLVFNRCDQVDAKKLARIQLWADELDPPKQRVVMASNGELPADLLTDSISRSNNAGALQGEHVHQFSSSAKPSGVTCDADRVFDEVVLLTNLKRLLDQGIAGNEVLRFKGLFQTDQGWRGIDIANREVIVKPLDYRGDNLIEWVTRPMRVEPGAMLAEIERPIEPAKLTAPGTSA